MFKEGQEVVCIRKQPWRCLTPGNPPPSIKYGDIVTIKQLVRRDMLFLEFQEYIGSIYGANNFMPLDAFTPESVEEMLKEEVCVS